MSSRRYLLWTLGEPDDCLSGQLLVHGWEPVIAADAAAVRRLLREHDCQVCVLLMRHAARAVVADIEACLRKSGRAEWIGVFGAGAMEGPGWRELVLNYFFDYHTLPIDAAHLAQAIGHAHGKALLRQEQEAAAEPGNDLGMIGHSEAIVALRRQIRKVADTGAPALIGGESGSGKELAAQAIHRFSPRAAKPFVAVNCGAIAPSLIQSELFGHERGSFTGAVTGRRGLIEAADGGTIFLDEIGDLSFELQANLLRFLQEKTISRVGATRTMSVDVRVIAASHVDLEKAVAAGRFRQDLYYRLNVLSLTVPPLRERKSDITLLAHHFLRRCAAERRQRLDGFSRQAIAAMLSHNWPGNVRELYNRVQRAVVMTEHRLIVPADLGFQEPASSGPIALVSARTIAERDAIRGSLKRVGHNVSQAARDLGISRMTLYRLMEKHGIALDVE